METPSMSSLEESFLQHCDSWFQSNQAFSVRGELGVFSKALVCWLGVQQRILGESLQSSLASLAPQIEESSLGNFVLNGGKKLKDKEISLNTGGLSRARKRLCLEEVDSLFRSATANIFNSLGLESASHRIYVLDGQNITVARSEDNLVSFGRTTNGMGELHFPRLRAVSLHELGTGICKDIAIGGWRDGEAELAKKTFEGIRKGSIVIMDKGFATPFLIRAARESEIQVIVRLKNRFGEKLKKLQGKSKQVIWKSKTGKYGAEQEPGRIVNYSDEAKGFRSTQFYFFTTAYELSELEIADLYRQRVRVEVFIRDVKQTLKMFFVRSKKDKNVEKEILIAYLTFNLIRAVMENTARALNISTERMSFTATKSLLAAYSGLLLRANNHDEIDLLLQRFRKNMLQAKLPKRKKQRNYRRVTKYPRNKYDTAAIFKEEENLAVEGK